MVRAWFVLLAIKAVRWKSPCRTKVGALYMQDGKWALGYNKSPAYGDHAEDVALANYQKKYGIEPKGGTMFCTLSACTGCARVLRERDIISVYLTSYTGKL